MFWMQADAGDPFVHKFTDAGILAHITGSDHAPVYADLQLPLPLPRGTSVPDLDLRNRRTGAGPRLFCASLLLLAFQGNLINSSCTAVLL